MYKCFTITAECPPLRVTSLVIRCVYQNRETSCDTGVRPGTVATPSCKPNYRSNSGLLGKQEQITCLSTGKWSSQPISCSPGEKVGKSFLSFLVL